MEAFAGPHGAGCPANTVPDVLGDWKVSSKRELPSRELAMTGAVGYISRTYTNPGKALAVSVLLLSGLPGAITTHTPDACYPGAGYTLGNAEKFPTEVWSRPEGRIPDRRGQPAWSQSLLPQALLGMAQLPGMVRARGRRGGPLPPSRCSRSSTSFGKRSEPRLLRKTIPATDS